MRLLTRYILWEITKVFTVCLFALTCLMILVVVVNQALRLHLTLGPILRLIPYAIPFAMRFTVPATMLYSVCAVYGRLSSDHEITAIKAAGVTPWAVMRPAIVMALFISPLAIYVNDLAVSWGQRGIHRVIIQSVEQIAYNRLRTTGSYATDKFSIRVARVEERRLIEPIISLRLDDEPGTITAKEAELKLDTANDVLLIKLVKCEVEMGDNPPIVFSEHEQEVSLREASQQGASSNRPADLGWSEIPLELEHQRQRVAAIESEQAALAAFQLLRGDLDALGDGKWSKARDTYQQAVTRMHKLETERWRRTAVGFSCLFFVLVGAPVAIYFKNSDFLSAFFACFLPILLLYYPMLMLAVGRAKEGALPPYTVWLGNVVFGLIGVWLIRKVIAGRPLMGFRFSLRPGVAAAT